MSQFPHLISISLPEGLIEELAAALPPRGRSAFARDALDAALRMGLRGHRRRRHSARACRQTTLLVSDEQREALNALSAEGELATFAELALRVALDRRQAV